VKAKQEAVGKDQAGVVSKWVSRQFWWKDWREQR